MSKETQKLNANFRHAFQKLGKGIEKAAKGFGHDIETAGKKLGKDIKTAAEDVGHEVKTVATDLKEHKVGQAFKDVGKGIKTSAEDIGHVAEGTVGLGASVSPVNLAVNGVKATGTKAAAAIGKAESVVGKVGSSVVDSLTGAVGSVAGDAVERVGIAGDTVGDVVHGNKKAAAADLKSFGQNLGDTAKNAAELALDVLPGADGLGVARTVATAAVDTAKTIKGVDTVGSAAKEGATSVEAAKEGAASVESAKDGVEGVGRAKTSTFKDIGEGVAGAATVTGLGVGVSKIPDSYSVSDTAPLSDGRSIPDRPGSGTYGPGSFDALNENSHLPSEAPPVYRNEGGPNRPESGTYGQGSFEALNENSRLPSEGLPPYSNEEAPPAYGDERTSLPYPSNSDTYRSEGLNARPLDEGGPPSNLSDSYRPNSALYGSHLLDPSAEGAPPNAFEREAPPVDQNLFDRGVMAENHDTVPSYTPEAYERRPLEATSELNLPDTTVPPVSASKVPTLVGAPPSKSVFDLKTPISVPWMRDTMGRV